MSESSINHVPASEIGDKARSGAVWSVIQIVARNMVSVGSTALLARMLTPDDYGLMGMVATLTALLLVFSDMGLSWATIQRRELNTAQVSNLFWINVLAGGVMWLACALAAPYVASFYGRAELVVITTVLGASFLLGGLSVQPFAIMRRRMDFRAIAEIEITAVVIGALAAIGVAIADLGYWALVAQALVSQLVRVAMALPRSSLRVRWPRLGVGTRALVGFGGLLAINGLLIYLARTLDSVLIGRTLGSQQLGYYDRAYFLMLLPSFVATGVLTNLMVSSLSAFQSDVKRFGEAYRRAVRLVAFMGCPMAIGLALTASETVQLVYGEKWQPVVPMLLWLSIAGITQPIYNTTGWLFTAVGRAGSYFVMTALNAAVLATTFFWCVRYGATAVAMGYGVVMGIILLWPALWMAHRSAEISLIDTGKSLLPVLAACGIMALAVFVVGSFARFAHWGWQSTMLLKVFLGIFTYMFCAKRFLAGMIRADLLPMLPAKMSCFVGRYL